MQLLNLMRFNIEGLHSAAGGRGLPDPSVRTQHHELPNHRRQVRGQCHWGQERVPIFPATRKEILCSQRHLVHVVKVRLVCIVATSIYLELLVHQWKNRPLNFFTNSYCLKREVEAHQRLMPLMPILNASIHFFVERLLSKHTISDSSFNAHVTGNVCHVRMNPANPLYLQLHYNYNHSRFNTFYNFRFAVTHTCRVILCILFCLAVQKL